MMPEYCTGMSHPPKSTILAPSLRCVAFSGVVFKAVAGMDIRSFSRKFHYTVVPVATLKGNVMDDFAALGRRVAPASIFLSAALAVAKISIGFMAGSTAVVSDG